MKETLKNLDWILLIVLVVLLIPVPFSLFLTSKTSQRRERNEEIRQEIAANIATCIEDGGLPEYTVNLNGKLTQYLGCVNP